MKTNKLLIAALAGIGVLAVSTGAASAAGPSFGARIIQACTQGTIPGVDSEVGDQVAEACGGTRGDKTACEVVSPDPLVCQTLTPKDASVKDCGSGSVTIEVDLSVGLPAGFSASGKVKATSESKMELKERKICEEGPALNATGGGTYVDESGLASYSFTFTLHGNVEFTHPTLATVKVEAGIACTHSADVPFEKDKSNSCEIRVVTSCVDDPSKCDQACQNDPANCEPGVIEPGNELPGEGTVTPNIEPDPYAANEPHGEGTR